jgi:hypothetical protein
MLFRKNLILLLGLLEQISASDLPRIAFPEVAGVKMNGELTVDSGIWFSNMKEKYSAEAAQVQSLGLIDNLPPVCILYGDAVMGPDGFQMTFSDSGINGTVFVELDDPPARGSVDDSDIVNPPTKQCYQRASNLCKAGCLVPSLGLIGIAVW